VLEFAGVFCMDNDLPSEELAPGQFAQGCSSHDLPDDASRLIFDEYTPAFYLAVPGA
jgi:hypothetical protein